ncbi:aspartate aminotransferase family protein [Demequina sp. TTPB684]|uniref:pyridoxal phosphate-dependent decarboxylase family protein n=1 Tax=unclassified Demequina TaxID=2620311 RepID=UPI001CF20941|nr:MULTISPECIES: pyridoxal-dependent decarboxylase [unclassified Demequina]MCB2412342.1 aspartate aminotransferase family protein [Demequina sp. TTPB684]UPU88505.1 pyridoxal-dependent decarboxylase [Demequina sp. TMPB413]
MTAELTAVHTHPRSLARLRERIAVTTEAARRAGGYLAAAPHRPIAPTADAVARLESFRRPLQDEPRAANDVLRELDEVGSPATVVQAMGRYFGYVNGGVEPAAAAASILAGAWDQNAALPAQSPAATVLDEVAAAWIVDLLGLPRDAVATFTTGATLANFTGIVTARDALLARAGWDVNELGLAGAPRLRVIVGDEVHISALKSLRLAGLAPGLVERVPVDERGAIDADAFPTDTDELTLVLLQAGNVTTGASDPFARIIPGVRERGGWVHVDGAFGLWAAASPTLAEQVAGVELADSWATDAHKWLNAPYDSGLVIVRHHDDLYRAMAMHAPYLTSTDARPLMHLSPHMSQRARGVETWALLAARGRSGIAELLDHSCSMAALFARLLRAAGAEVLVEPTLNQVPVAFGRTAGARGDDDVTSAVISAIGREGTLWAGGSVWHGRTILRLSVSDAATTPDDVHASVDAILRCWHSVLGAS